MGYVATQMGDRAESDVSEAGRQDRNGAWTLLSHTLPPPLPIPLLRGRERNITAYGLGVAQQGGSFLLFYLCPDFTRSDRQEGAF